MTLTHITLTTGHRRQSPRSEVGDDVIALLSDLIPRALAAEAGVPIPRVRPECRVSGAAAGQCLLVTIWGPPYQGEAAPIVSIGIAAGEDGAPDLWEHLHRLQRVTTEACTSPDSPPPAPWCGAALLPGIAIYPDAGSWIGDLERCLAWAWVERCREAS